MDDLKQIVSANSNLISLAFKLISFVGIMMVVFSSFFLFTNLTTEFYDTAKFLVLLIVTAILLLILGIRFALSNKVAIIRTPLDIPLLLLLAVGIVSTFLSPSPFVALLGNQSRIHGSLSSLAVYVIFYLVLVNTLKSQTAIKWLVYLATLGAAILACISLLAYTGVKILPDPWVHGINFTTTGSSFSTTAVLALLLPFVVLNIFSKNLTLKIASSVLFGLFGITIALTGSWTTWIAALVGFTLTFFIVGPVKEMLQINLHSLKNSSFQANLIGLFAPLILICLVVLLSLLPPMGGAKNPLNEQFKNFPREIQLGVIPSWKVSVSTFRDSPFWGSGPATYLFDFTNYKPIEVNQSTVWNIRFDGAFNEYFQVLATLGGVGLVALLSLTALYISSAYPYIVFSLANEFKRTLAVSGLLFFLILALHPGSLVVWVIGLIILAAFFVVNIQDESSKSWGFSGNIQQTLKRLASNVTSGSSSQETIKIEALPSILLTIFLGIVIFAFYFAGKFIMADYHHRIALNSVAQNQGVVAYNELIAAEKLNPYSDLYRVDLAQTNFALANAIASAKGPTEASPSGFLTDQDKQNIQILLQQSINEGRMATNLSPRSVINWEILGLLYRQIAGVADNALVFSLDSYGKAIFQDPLNPMLRLSVGGVYYAIANYDLAIRFFTDAINLKPDFPNGYFNLSVALRDKGDLNSAQAAAEKVLTLVEGNSQDYKLIQDYLTDLKNRIASGSAQQSQIQPPAAQTTGSLQQKELPKVVNVGNPPEKIATPPAVKKPDSTPEPTPNP